MWSNESILPFEQSNNWKACAPSSVLETLGRHPLQKISYSDHAIRISHDLQYELHFPVASSFLSSQWRSGNMMSRIRTTVGSIKLQDATLTQTVRVGCSELHSPNESGARSSLRVARTPFLAPRGVRASYDSYTRAHRVLRGPSDELREPRMVFWRANVATA